MYAASIFYADNEGYQLPVCAEVQYTLLLHSLFIKSDNKYGINMIQQQQKYGSFLARSISYFIAFIITRRWFKGGLDFQEMHIGVAQGAVDPGGLKCHYKWKSRGVCRIFNDETLKEYFLTIIILCLVNEIYCRGGEHGKNNLQQLY